MSDLPNATKRVLLVPAPAKEREATTVLATIAGRGPGQFGPRLTEWLNSNPAVYPEPVNAEYIDNPQDHGVDVLLTGLQTGTRVGFQIKSENDLAAKDFAQKLKAQITETQAWGLSLLVIIFACPPTQANILKYQHFQIEVGRYVAPRMMVLGPDRAAGLWKAFNGSIQAPPQAPADWSRFFVEAGQEGLAPLYLDEWFPLTPDQRFEAPAEYEELAQSIRDEPLTILVGPPASGKTFAAIQLLWQAFARQTPIRWIGPATPWLAINPLGDEQPLADMGQRTELLVRQLGVKPFRPPLDTAEFVVRNLEPGTLVYIEDPFGKTPHEFDRSLHTVTPRGGPS